MVYTVGEMAKKLDVPASTLRYYDKEGLLPFVERSSGGIRMFQESDFEWLQVIGCMKKADEAGKKRALSVPNAKTGQIPIIGVVTAGIPILAVENQEGTMPWDGDPNCFALRVRGDSMTGAAILDGDLVVVRPQQSADDGQIVVALLGDEATVKRFRRQRGRVWLQPENPNYMPIDASSAKLLGLVKAVVRNY